MRANMAGSPTDLLLPPQARPDTNEDPVTRPTEDTFLQLLAALEHRPIASNRSDVIARYQAWIGRNSAASTALHAAWFNLGVELAAAGDKAGAIDAYQRALALKPGFYPAALNLGTLLEAIGQPDAALTVWQQALQPEEARAALLEHRDQLIKSGRLARDNVAKLLNVGCGNTGREYLPAVFRRPGWQEIRLDNDTAAHPDILASMTDMRAVSDSLVEAVYSSHALTHLYPHEVPTALREMHRVLKPAGFAFITLPDLQEVARNVSEGRLVDPVYLSPAGPIAPIDILYGHRPSLANGDVSVAPRTGFTDTTLGRALVEAGFAAVMMQREPSACRLTAIAFRTAPDQACLANAQEQMLPSADRPALLYTPAG